MLMQLNGIKTLYGFMEILRLVIYLWMLTLSAVIDGAAALDPARNLVVAQIYLSGKAHKAFISEMDMDTDMASCTCLWLLAERNV